MSFPLDVSTPFYEDNYPFPISLHSYSKINTLKQRLFDRFKHIGRYRRMESRTAVSHGPSLLLVAFCALKMAGFYWKRGEELTQQVPRLPFGWQGLPFERQAEAMARREAKTKRSWRRDLSMVG